MQTAARNRQPISRGTEKPLLRASSVRVTGTVAMFSVAPADDSAGAAEVSMSLAAVVVAKKILRGRSNRWRADTPGLRRVVCGPRSYDRLSKSAAQKRTGGNPPNPVIPMGLLARSKLAVSRWSAFKAQSR